MTVEQAAVVITIDGPSGSGKGTIAQLLAERLHLHLLDSGALYRLTALAAQKHGVDHQDEEAVAALAAQLDVRFETAEGETRVFLEGEEVGQAIRREDISLGASRVAALPRVREALLDRQQRFGGPPGLVADGRDMGTVVFPWAELKIYLTASAEERARRRHEQLKKRGDSVSLPALIKDIQARDERDSQRAASPLKPADDALILDSTELSIVEVLDRVTEEAAQRGIGPSA